MHGGKLPTTQTQKGDSMNIPDRLEELEKGHSVCGECGKIGHTKDMEEFVGSVYINACKRDGESSLVYVTRVYDMTCGWTIPTKDETKIHVHPECSKCITFGPCCELTALDIRCGFGYPSSTGEIVMGKTVGESLRKHYEKLINPKPKKEKK